MTNSNATLLLSEFDHPWCSGVREGVSLLRASEWDINTVEAVPREKHQHLTNIGPNMFILENGVISFHDFNNKILSNRVEAFQSPEVAEIIANMDNQLHRTFTVQNYIDASERGAVRNRKLARFIADSRGLTTDSFKSLVYPTQVYNESVHFMEGITTRLLSPETLQLKDKKEIHSLLAAGQDYLYERISIIAQFRDSQPYLIGTAQDGLHRFYLENLVARHNKLVDLAGALYKTSGTPCTVPSSGRRGKIFTSLDDAIHVADELNFKNQWEIRGGTPRQDYLAEDKERSLNSQVSLILSTNSLLTDPLLVGKESRVTVNGFTKSYKKKDKLKSNLYVGKHHR